MKRFLIPISVFIVCVAASVVSIVAKVSENSGVDNLAGTKTIAISDFDEIETSIVSIELVDGMASGEARLEAPQEMMDKIEVRVDDGTLKVGFKNKVNSNSKKNGAPRLFVACRPIKSIEASTAAVVKATTLPTVDELEIEASTAATVAIDSINARKIELEAETAATLSIANVTAVRLKGEASTGATLKIKSGKASFAEFSGSTGASLLAKGVKANAGKASASTGATVRTSIKNATVSSDTGGCLNNK